MNARQLILTGFFIGVSVLALDARGGACDPETEAREQIQRRVDGPANVRVVPNGQAIGSIPNRTRVTIIGFQDVNEHGRSVIWYHVKWKQGGKTRDGWTHEQNIICD